MNVVAVDVAISSISAVVAIFSAALAFYMYKTSKNTLERYDSELDFLRKQSRSHFFLEARNALDNINEKIVEWDLDLTDYEENENLTIKDKQIIVWILHHINLSVYTLAQCEIVGNEYVEMIRKRSIYNIRKLISENEKAKNWMLTVRDYRTVDKESNRFERYFYDLVNEVISDHR